MSDPTGEKLLVRCPVCGSSMAYLNYEFDYCIPCGHMAVSVYRWLLQKYGLRVFNHSRKKPKGG